MERLTVPYEYGDGYRSKCAETCGECDGCWGLDEIVNRLGAYEDTELTPEEVNDAVLGAKLMAKSQLVSAFGVAAERLRELAEADKAGRVVVLPCKPGDILWTFCSYPIKQVYSFQVCSFTATDIRTPNGRTMMNTSRCGVIDVLAVGKTVFLTREEAEKALEAMKDG